MMFYHLFVFNLLLIVCNSQDRFTCVRSNQVINSTSAPSRSNLRSTSPTWTQRGLPGKRGPIGIKGDTGPKGNKGEPGLMNDSVMEVLRGKNVNFYKVYQVTNVSLNFEYKLISTWVLHT